MTTSIQEEQSHSQSEIRNVDSNISDISSQMENLNVNLLDKKGDEKINSDDSRKNLIVNYLPPAMTEEALGALFSSYGQLEAVKIVVDLQTGKSRGYGFVKFSNPDNALRAIKELNGYEINKKRIKVAYARPKSREIQNANLYITGLPPHVDEEKLVDLFKDFGAVIEARILRNPDNTPKGVGFIRLDTHENAIRAAQQRDGFIVDSNFPGISCKISQRPPSTNVWNNTNNNNNSNNHENDDFENRQYNNMSNMNRRGTRRGSPNRSSGISQRHEMMPKLGQYSGPSGSGQFFSKNNSSSGFQSFNNRGGNNENFSPRGGRHNRGRNFRGGQYRQRDGTNPSSRYPTNLPMYGMYDPTFQPPAPAQPPIPQYYQSAPPTGMSATTVSTGPNTGMQQPQQYTSNLNFPTYNIVVYNIPPKFSVDHLIQMFIPYGPIHSVNIHTNSLKGPYGVISYLHFEDAQRAQSDSNGRKIENQHLEVHLQPK